MGRNSVSSFVFKRHRPCLAWAGPSFIWFSSKAEPQGAALLSYAGLSGEACVCVSGEAVLGPNQSPLWQGLGPRRDELSRRRLIGVRASAHNSSSGAWLVPSLGLSHSQQIKSPPGGHGNPLGSHPVAWRPSRRAAQQTLSSPAFPADLRAEGVDARRRGHMGLTTWN